METQQSYKFLTDLGLAQYDATVRQYMEDTFAKKGETPSGSGINIVKATCHPKEESDEGEYIIDSIDTEPQQIWDFLNDGEPVIIVVESTLSDIVGKVILIPGYFVESVGDKKGKHMIFSTNVEGFQCNMIFVTKESSEWDYVFYTSDITRNPLIHHIDWLSLKEMRDNGKLIPGRQYCIDDYVFSCSQYGIVSGNHHFGIIVTADDSHTLNENARAIDLDHDYFNDCDLNAWELKYCLDNDVNRFGWAPKEVLYYNDGHTQFKCPLIEKTDAFWVWEDSRSEKNRRLYTAPNPSSGDSIFLDSLLQDPISYVIDDVESVGNGVIYWMRDEYGNEAPYDFKNAMFNGSILGLTDYAGTPLTDSYYTFSINRDSIIDASILRFNNSKSLYGIPITRNNIVEPNSSNRTIPVNIFFAKDSTDIAGVQGIIGNEIGVDSIENLFFENCAFNKLGTLCRWNKFAEYCKGNIMVDQCYGVTLGPTSSGNIFKGYCDRVQGNWSSRGITAFIDCEFGANIGALTFNKCTPIENVTVDNGVWNIDPTELWAPDWARRIQKFIGLGNDGQLHCVQGIDGFGGGGNTAPLSVAVTLGKQGEFESADHYLSHIWDAIKQNRPVFMHVYLPAGEILFLQLSKIVEKGAAWFSILLDGVYYECKIAEKPAECYFTQDAVIENMSKDIKDLDTRVTALEGGEKPRYDVDLLYDGQTVLATIEITGEEPPAKASDTTWTAQIVECNDFPELVGTELTGTGSDIETAKFTGTSAAGKPITANIKQYPKYTVSISNKDTGVDSSCVAELINTRQDKTEGWLYDMRTRECPEYPELVKDGFMLKNGVEDKIDNATGSFTTDKGEVLYLSIAIK